MPRLIGKRSNDSALTTTLLLFVLAVGAVAAEYYGVIDTIPNFGNPQLHLEGGLDSSNDRVTP